MKYAFRPPGSVRLVQCCAERQSYDSIISELKAKHELRVMLDLPPSEVDRFMTKAMKQSMDSRYHQYIITSMDVHTMNVASWWPKNGTGAGQRPGVYGLRILDPSDGAVRGVIRDWNFGELLFGRRVDQRTLRTMNALIYDAVALLSRSFHDLDTSQAIETLNISCSITNPQAFWPYGGSLVSYMKMVQVKGLTGDVRLNERGARRDLVLDVVKIREDAFAKVGTWTRNSGVVATAPSRNVSTGDISLRHRQLLRVIAIVHPPYVIAKSSGRFIGVAAVNGTSELRLTGFAIELLDILARALGLDYEVRVSREDYGSLSPNGTWTGLVRQVYEREADLGVGDISITRERLEYIDFTAPFMQNGIGILYRNVDRQFEEIPHFLRPWTSELWLYVLTAVLATSVLFSFLSRLSSAEWVCKRRAGSSCRKLAGKGRLKNRFTLINSFWFVLASLLQQGTDMFPRALATRIMAAAWWMFAFVLISSYTASLASQLIAQRLHVPSIQSIQELAKQSRITYGCVLKGPIKAFLRDSADPCLQRVWSVMEMSTTSVFTNTLAQGVDRVKNEPGYAFLTDSQTVDYLVHHDCSFAQLPGFLETGGFGFAAPHGSPITQLLTNKILQLQEDGTLRALRHRWWSSPVSAKRCASGASAEGTSQKEAFSIGALVVALTIGCLVSLFIVVLECLWKIRCTSRKERGFFLWEKIRRGVNTSESLQDSNLIVLDPPKEFQDDQDNLPMTSYKGDSLA